VLGGDRDSVGLGVSGRDATGLGILAATSRHAAEVERSRYAAGIVLLGRVT